MSAYIVSKEHIVFMVKAALGNVINRQHSAFYWHHEGESKTLYCSDYPKAVELANMLWQENIKSVSARYPNEAVETLPGPVGECFEITERDICGHVEVVPVQVLKSCDCYEYQSCEHEGWLASEAYAFIMGLRKAAWRALPGYEDAAWGAPERRERRAA